MSEQAPERAGPPPAGKKENVFTRKLGPLPMWMWLAIVALVILLYVVFKGNKGKGGTGQQQGGQQGGFGRFLQPFTILRGPRGPAGPAGPAAPPHTKHHPRRGDHDDDDQRDRDAGDHDGRMRRSRGPLPPPPGGLPPGPPPGPMPPPMPGSVPRTLGARDQDTVGVDWRVKRQGQQVPGELVPFKTAETGNTPPLIDVANHYGTSPDAIVMEAEGRGYPTSNAWKRYVARHDWASPLPPATELMILAHPS